MTIAILAVLVVLALSVVALMRAIERDTEVSTKLLLALEERERLLKDRVEAIDLTIGFRGDA